MGRSFDGPRTLRKLERWLDSPFTRLRDWFSKRQSKTEPGTWAWLSPPPIPEPEVRALLDAAARSAPRNAVVEWPPLAAALDYAAAQNAYETAAVLADQARERLAACPKALKRRVLRRVIDSLAARGETDALLEILAAHPRDLPKTGCRPEYFTGAKSKGTVGLRERHALYRAWAARAPDARDAAEHLRVFWQEREILRQEPALQLFLFHACRVSQVEPERTARPLNRYLAGFGLLPLELEPRLTDNVLRDLRANRRVPRKSKVRSEHDAQPLVSVVCSAYRAAHTLEYAVGSLLAQTHERLEILICEDRGDDETFEVAKRLAQKDSRIRLFRSKRNQGTYNIRNALLAEARGDYVTFHDSDDFSLPERIEWQLRAIRESGAKACVANWVRILPSGLVVFFRDGKERRLSIVSLMVERDSFAQLLPYRSARHSADLEMYDRLLASLSPPQASPAQGSPGHVPSRSGVARVTAPLILGLWSAQSLTRGSGAEALENGYRAPSRRRYAELCFRQRLWGKAQVTDAAIDAELRGMDNYLEPSGIEEFEV